MKIQDVTLTSIKPYDANPRVGDVEVIAESLKANGQYKPIVVQQSTKKILAGNHTFLAAKKLGWKKMSVVYVDVDDEQAKRIVLADNRTSDFGGYEESVLGDLLASLESIEGTGYTQEEADVLTAMLDDTAEALASLEMPDVPQYVDADEEAEEPTVESGEWDDVESVLPGVVQLENDAVFLPVYDQRNIYEMPEFLEDQIPDISQWNIDTWVGPDFSPQTDTPDKHWLYLVRTSTTGIPWERAVPCFYTRDYRFESWWDQPSAHVSRLLNLGVTTVIEHDFSTASGLPTAVNIWQVYRSRWLARYMQEAGLDVIPNLGVLSADKGMQAYTVPGLPAEPASGAMQFQTIDNNEDAFRADARSVNVVLNEQVCPRTLIAYGGDKAKAIMAKVTYSGEVIFAETYTALRMRLIEERRKATEAEALAPVRAAKKGAARKVSTST